VANELVASAGSGINWKRGSSQLAPVWLDLQTKPQLLPSQVAVALAGGLHSVHAAPQVATAKLDAQTLLLLQG
jgi:hypothetical protein